MKHSLQYGLKVWFASASIATFLLMITSRSDASLIDYLGCWVLMTIINTIVTLPNLFMLFLSNFFTGTPTIEVVISKVMVNVACIAYWVFAVYNVLYFPSISTYWLFAAYPIALIACVTFIKFKQADKLPQRLVETSNNTL